MVMFSVLRILFYRGERESLSNVILHPAITVNKKSESQYVTMVKEQLGNATRESDISLTFSVDGSKLKNLNALPFQVSMWEFCHLFFFSLFGTSLHAAIEHNRNKITITQFEQCSLCIKIPSLQSIDRL